MKIKSAKYILSAATLALAFGLTAPAQAALNAVSGVAGPVLANGDPTQVAVDPNNGFPLWYEDVGGGLRLALCLDQNGFCLTEEPTPGAPINFPDNFGPEAFWWMAETTAVGQGINGLLVLALEAAFANEVPVEGDQVAFARIRIRIDVPTPGIYTVTHPFGVATYDVAAVDVPGGGGANEINETQDIGNFLLPGRPADGADYRAALLDGTVGLVDADGRSIGPFLTATGGNVTDTVTENVYLANPAIPTTVIGSPLGTNLFSITGPGGVSATTDLFTLMGKVSGCGAGNLPPVTVADHVGAVTGTPTVINVLANDHNDPAQIVDGIDVGSNINPASVVIATSPVPANTATVVANPDGTITVTPAAGVTGVVTFTYAVSDFCGLISPQATVSVFVEDMQVKADYRTRTGRWSLTGSGNIRDLSTGTDAFFSELNGAQEVPSVTTAGEGKITATLRTDGILGQVIDYTLTYSGLADVTQAHIHNGAVGVNGPVNVFLCTTAQGGTPPVGAQIPPVCPATAGTVSGTLSAADFISTELVTTFAELVAEIQAGGTYANVHTAANPTGEIRGQVGRNVISLRAGTTGPAIDAAEVQADGTWGFTGKSAVSPGAAATVQADSATGATVTRTLRKR
jgi:hypothetical protein